MDNYFEVLKLDEIDSIKCSTEAELKNLKSQSEAEFNAFTEAVEQQFNDAYKRILHMPNNPRSTAQKDLLNLAKKVLSDRNTRDQHITDLLTPQPDTLKSNWHFVTVVTLGLALVICLIAFLTQMDAKDTALSQKTELTKQLTQKESEIYRKDLKIKNLTSSVQTLNSTNQELSGDNDGLQNELDRISGTNTRSGDVVNLRRQLSEQEDVNQELQAQLIQKNTEIRQLRNDKAAALNKNQELKKQLVWKRSGICKSNCYYPAVAKGKNGSTR